MFKHIILPWISNFDKWEKKYDLNTTLYRIWRIVMSINGVDCFFLFCFDKGIAVSTVCSYPLREIFQSVMTVQREQLYGLQLNVYCLKQSETSASSYSTIHDEMFKTLLSNNRGSTDPLLFLLSQTTPLFVTSQKVNLNMTSRSRGEGVKREPQHPAGPAVLKLRRPPSAPDRLQSALFAEWAANLSGQTHKTAGCYREKNIGSTWLWALFVFGSGYAILILFLNGFRQVKFLPRSLVISAKHLTWKLEKEQVKEQKL